VTSVHERVAIGSVQQQLEELSGVEARPGENYQLFCMCTRIRQALLSLQVPGGGSAPQELSECALAAYAIHTHKVYERSPLSRVVTAFCSRRRCRCCCWQVTGPHRGSVVGALSEHQHARSCALLLCARSPLTHATSLPPFGPIQCCCRCCCRFCCCCRCCCRCCSRQVTDLHRESIDHITIPSREGRGVLRRIDEVFDCWFESGSMPYAQLHYPFENKASSLI
jgi:tRNA synthetases class I (I, L, M and V)